MQITEAYSLLFTDSIISGIAITFRTDFVYPVMLIFGTYNLLAITLIQILGKYIAIPINYLLGSMIKSAVKNKISDNAAINFFRKYNYYFLIFAWVPVIGGFIIAATGFTGVKFKRIITASFALVAVYYGIFIL